MLHNNVNKSFFIGIDSDGTAFDSMTVKHRRAFIPTIIKTWNLDKASDAVYEICEDINLFSKTRGIDRFSGLVPTFERLKAAGADVPDYTDLYGFLNSGSVLSNSGLKEYLENNDSKFLREVLKWSIEADALFKKEAEKLMPFKGLKEILKSVGKYADIAVISSASESSLKKDWKKDGLINEVSIICGQEQGKKTQQLESALDGRYDRNKAMMFGDALGDYHAAKNVGIWFYPILPGKEEASWQRFKEKYFDIFFSGSFSKNCEEELLDEFCSVLKTEKGQM